MAEAKQPVRICIGAAQLNHLVECGNRCFVLALACADQANTAVGAPEVWELCHRVSVIHQRIVDLVLLKLHAAEREVNDRRHLRTDGLLQKRLRGWEFIGHQLPHQFQESHVILSNTRLNVRTHAVATNE